MALGIGRIGTGFMGKVRAREAGGRSRRVIRPGDRAGADCEADEAFPGTGRCRLAGRAASKGRRVRVAEVTG